MEFSGRQEVVKSLASGTIQQREFSENSGPWQDVDILKNGIAQQQVKTDITSYIDTMLRNGSGSMK